MYFYAVFTILKLLLKNTNLTYDERRFEHVEHLIIFHFDYTEWS